MLEYKTARKQIKKMYTKGTEIQNIDILTNKK